MYNPYRHPSSPIPDPLSRKKWSEKETDILVFSIFMLAGTFVCARTLYSLSPDDDAFGPVVFFPLPSGWNNSYDLGCGSFGLEV